MERLFRGILWFRELGRGLQLPLRTRDDSRGPWSNTRKARLMRFQTQGPAVRRPRSRDPGVWGPLPCACPAWFGVFSGAFTVASRTQLRVKPPTVFQDLKCPQKCFSRCPQKAIILFATKAILFFKNMENEQKTALEEKYSEE